MSPSPQPPPRIGLVGYGRIALKHLEVFRALSAPVAAVCDASPERRKAAAESGLGRGYASVGELIEKERPDGIVSCVSFDQNAAVAREAAAAGIPILLEKPPGLSTAECRELIDLSARHRAPVLAAFNRRHYSVLRRALEDAGGPAQVTSVSVQWSEDPRKLAARFSPGQISRMIFGNTIHGLDMMAYLSGPLPDPSIAARSLGDPFRWQMALHGLSDRGVLATFESTWDSPVGWRLAFCTPGRRYVFAPLESCVVEEGVGKPVRPIEPDEFDRRFKPGFHRQALMFLDVIRSRSVPEGFGLETALPAMDLAERLTQTCLAAHSAASRGASAASL